MCKVLVVDDDRDLADMLVYLLNLSGHDVRAVNDGLAAVAELMSWRPGAAVLDVGLPYLDGVQVANHARKHYGTSVRLVAYTAHDASQRRVAEAGFDVVVAKSAPIDDLLDAIAIDERKLAGAAPPGQYGLVRMLRAA